MEETSNTLHQGDVYSNAIKAGKRTYFFDVKLTRSEEKYITITESKRKYDEGQEKYFYEKHKIFLYREDFRNFVTGLAEAIAFIGTEDDVAEFRELSSEILEKTSRITDELAN
ncbi:MAG TPA: DUF3276 family protein [Lentimicrobium sp.]|jgi:hypothetical protein|nr:DUF3276 family protein [Lentimicrobium sp.]